MLTEQFPYRIARESANAYKSDEDLDREDDETDQKHQNRNLVDRMHGPQIEAIAAVSRGCLLFECDVRNELSPDFHDVLPPGQR